MNVIALIIIFNISYYCGSAGSYILCPPTIRWIYTIIYIALSIFVLNISSRKYIHTAFEAV